MPYLDIRGLSVTLKTPAATIEAVRNVNLAVEKGEFYGIVGESGSGKTMACTTLLGLSPRSAHIDAEHFELDGTDMLNADWDDIRGRRVAMIFQDPAAALNPVFTIGYQIDRVLRCHTDLSKNDRKARSIQLLENVQLPNPQAILRKYPRLMSGGMQQRALIAIALSAGADLLIADEPTTALDVTMQAEILRLLGQLRDELGLTILFITHDLGVVMYNCDRASVLRLGEVVESGPVEVLLNHPEHPYTKALIASIPSRNKRGELLPTVLQTLTERGAA